MSTNPVSADLPGPASGAFQHADTVTAGLRFHYLFQGAGFPVILLSGFPESSYAWRKVIPQLASDYRVIAPDLPGQGDSDLPTEGYDTATVAKRLDLFISGLGLERFHLVGHDVAVPESMEQNRALAENKLSFPVLAIGGERGSTPHLGNDLLPIAPKTRGLMFPCGHYVPEEEPDRLVRQLRAFLKAAGR